MYQTAKHEMYHLNLQKLLVLKMANHVVTLILIGYPLLIQPD